MKTIEINLLGPEARPESAATLPSGIAAFLASVEPALVQVSLAAVLLAFAVPYVADWVVETQLIGGANVRIDDLDRQIQESHKDVDRIAALQAQVGQLEQDVQALQGLMSQGATWAPTLEEIRALTPTDLWLTGLTTQGETLSLQGNAADYKAIAYFYANLQHARNVTNPVLGGVTQSAGDGPVAFSLTCTLARRM